eukprot:SAG22_NODE_5694_length_970_cov_1.707233_1_plen_236_part_00
MVGDQVADLHQRQLDFKTPPFPTNPPPEDDSDDDEWNGFDAPPQGSSEPHHEPPVPLGSYPGDGRRPWGGSLSPESGLLATSRREPAPGPLHSRRKRRRPARAASQRLFSLTGTSTLFFSHLSQQRFHLKSVSPKPPLAAAGIIWIRVLRGPRPALRRPQAAAKAIEYASSTESHTIVPFAYPANRPSHEHDDVSVLIFEALSVLVVTRIVEADRFKIAISGKFNSFVFVLVEPV